MKKLLLYSLITASVFSSTQTIQAQTAPVKQWDKTFGGNSIEEISSIQQILGGGYIINGSSQSGISGDKSQASQGIFDFWVLKLDASGNKLWDKAFGGSGTDISSCLVLTSDGGFIVGGWSFSGISGDKSQPNLGNADYWIIKLDSNGNKQWDKTFGGNGSDTMRSLRQTSDGGYILCGESSSGVSGDKTQPLVGVWDYWAVKLDASGNKQWDKTFGGADIDELHSLIQTSDGGYMLGGLSYSGISGDKTQASRGDADYWIIKLNANGTKVWDKSIGGSSYDELYSLKQTIDGGYILGGSSNSGIGGDKSQAPHGTQGYSDYWIVKLDATGNKQWDKSLGGDNRDFLYELDLTSDGGYILGGRSFSQMSGDKSEAGLGNGDYWIVKIDSNGNKLWDKTLAGNNEDYLNSVRQTSDNGYIIGGLSDSGISGDKTQPSKGGFDYWIIKLGPDAITGLSESLTTNLTLYPNPTTGIIHLELKEQQPTQISVYNSLGQTILTKTEARPNPDGKLQIDLSNQAKGIYTIQVISGNKSAVKRVVLE